MTSYDAIRMRIARSQETPEQRETRLSKQREYARARRASETPEQRLTRLENQRSANRKRRYVSDV